MEIMIYKIFKARGRVQITIFGAITLTIIIILYKISSSDFLLHNELVVSDITTTRKKLPVDINELSSLTQSIEHLTKQHEYEIKIMADINSKRHLENSYKEWSYVKESQNFPGEKIVHLDLKGAPPKVSYYEEFFRLISSMGATGLLIEYEDMFPYKGPILEEIAAYNAYTLDEIQIIKDTAKKHNLKIIPLIQTFGHMEFLLKLKKFVKVREVERYPQVICPVRNGTFSIITAMIDQIIDAHPDIQYLHIGCDEVYYIGKCTYCGQAMEKHMWTETDLFLNHVKRIAKYIKQTYPKITPMTWDDEFRKLSLEELKASGLPKLIVPMIWKYTQQVFSELTSQLWDKYAAVFDKVWIASAFKGATGPDQILTDISVHLDNHRSWMEIVNQYQEKIKFEGIAITGWQRYDHFSVLCELLPVGLPSLAFNLHYLNSESKFGIWRVRDRLQCEGNIPMMISSSERTRCHFPGAKVLDAVERVYALRNMVAHLQQDSNFAGWFHPYNRKMNFASPSHVEYAASQLDRCLAEINYIEQDLRKAMIEVYDHSTITEWIATHLQPLADQLRKWIQDREMLLSYKFWPRRPLTTNNYSPHRDKEKLSLL